MLYLQQLCKTRDEDDLVHYKQCESTDRTMLVELNMIRNSAITYKRRPLWYAIWIQAYVSVIRLAKWRHLYCVDWRFCRTYSQHCVPFDALNEGITSSYRVHIWYWKTRMAGLQSCWGSTMMAVAWAQYINMTDKQLRRHTKCCPNALRRASKTARRRFTYNCTNFLISKHDSNQTLVLCRLRRLWSSFSWLWFCSSIIWYT